MPNFPASAFQRLTGLQSFPQPAIIPTHLPVVMMHGFGIGGSFRRGGHLHEQAMYLRMRGVRAYAPNVSPYNTVRARCQTWKHHIEHVLHETGADAVSLIAHSMGGLDARFLISQMGLHDRIGALVTIATPHRGSELANLVLQQPDAVRSWMADMADWLGTHIIENGSANSLQTVRELTPSFMTHSFNPNVPDHPNVHYWSYAGRAGRDTNVPLTPLLRYFNAYLYEREGCNDGFVSVESAKWGTFKGVLDADHIRQVGMDAGFGGADFDANTFYADVALDLADVGL
ncbi:MAG: lipase family alpha/beta hydrolase [Bacteroidota bacterium]